MIVQQSKIPVIKYPIASSSPPNIIQKMFSSIELVFSPVIMFFPNGKNETEDSLKHWIPTGMPIIVMHQSSPINSHAIPEKNPQTINQMMFPRNFKGFIKKLRQIKNIF